MPNYTIINERLSSIERAKSVQPKLQSTYQEAKSAVGLVQLFQAGTDAEFNEMINAIFSLPERTAISQMLGNLNTLVNAWEANAGTRAMLGLPPI